jgi:hypothetical protein
VRKPVRDDFWPLDPEKLIGKRSLSLRSRVANAAPEWQARSFRWRSSELMVACPFEGLVSQIIAQAVTQLSRRSI